MRILLIGAGGVGDAIAKIAARRDFFELLVVSDYDPARAERTIGWIAARHGSDVAARFVAARVDASDPESVAALAREHRVTHVMNAVEPKFVPTVFAGALAAGADYLDMAMSLSEPRRSSSSWRSRRPRAATARRGAWRSAAKRHAPDRVARARRRRPPPSAHSVNGSPVSTIAAAAAAASRIAPARSAAAVSGGRFSNQ